MFKNILLRNVMIKGNIHGGIPIEIQCDIQLDMLRPLDSTHAVQDRYRGQDLDHINKIARHAVYKGFHGAIAELTTLLEKPIGYRKKQKCWMWYVFPTSSRPTLQPTDPKMQVKNTEQDRYIEAMHGLNMHGLNMLEEWKRVITMVSQIDALTRDLDAWRLQQFLNEWMIHLSHWFTEDKAVIDRLINLSKTS